MTNEPPLNIAELAGRAIVLAEQVQKTQQEIVRQQAKNKRNIRLIVASVLLDVTLSIVCVFLATDQSNVSDRIQQTQIATCSSDNSLRDKEIRLWNYVISLSPPPVHETAAEKQVRLEMLSKFRQHVATQFSPLNCEKLYHP